MKNALIFLPGGLGDILFLQKLSHLFIEDGYKVTWPVFHEFKWLGDYIPDINWVVLNDWEINKDLPEDERIYYPVRHMCQFSWYCDGKSDKARDGDAWRRAQVIAYMIHKNRKYRGITEGATHYHATYVSPKWAPELDLVGRIGTHIFYRWP